MKLHHYVIIRKDMPLGDRLAQTIHASDGSAAGPLPDDTHAYALEVDDEAALLDRAQRLWDAGVPHRVIVETDGALAGQATAIGIFPTEDKDSMRKHLSDLRLAR